MTDFEHIRTRHDNGILHVELHRPERLNALHTPAHLELASAFDAFEADPGLRVAIITGHGRAFCAGNDLKWQASGSSMDRPPSGFGGLTLRHERRKPVIAAVNGVALGGGCEIVLATDLAIAAASATFGLPEVLRGLVPLAGVHLLPRAIGTKAAMAMLLTSATIDAAEALRIGIVNEVVPDGQVHDAAMVWARRIIAASPQALSTCLDMVKRSLGAPSIEAAMTQSYESLEKLRSSEDFREGPLAFAEKRKPKWMS